MSTRIPVGLVALLFVSLCFAELNSVWAMPVGGELITVTTDEDVTDFGGAQQVSDLPGPDGRVSFHEAVFAADNTPGPQTIHFEIPQSDWDYDPAQATIKLVTHPFVIYSDEVTIDFTTQTDFTGNTNPDGNEVSIVGLQGNGAGAPAIVLEGNYNTVIGLDHVRDRGYGIAIRGHYNQVLSCTISGPLFAAVYINGNFEVPATHNVIGGTGEGDGNTLAAGNAGVRIDAPADNNVVIGNRLGGAVSGVQVRGAPCCDIFPHDNRIGGPTPEERNVIGGSGYSGEHGSANGDLVRIEYAFGTLVEGNYIGTEEDGLTADQQIAPNGIEVRESDDTIVRNNLIAGINGNGILLYGKTNNTLVYGNLIGTDKTGLNPLPNWYGVRVASFGSMNLPGPNFIGGVEPGQANLIAFNEGPGVLMSSLANNARISGNSIHSNGGLGIDLIPWSGVTGVTPNDPGDVDTQGGNRLQNFPEIVAASSDGVSATFIDGLFSSTPNTEFSLEFFSSSESHSSGYGEGENLLGLSTITTDSNGTALIAIEFPIGTPPGFFVSATATNNETNDTSEFSNSVPVQFESSAPELVDFEVTSGNHTGGGLADLVASDDLSLEIESDGSTLRSGNATDIVFYAHAPSSGFSTMELAVESRISNFAGGFARIYMYNWNTERFDLVRIGGVAILDSQIATSGISAADYIDSSGNVQIKLNIRPLSVRRHLPLSRPFSVNIDLVEIKLK